MRKDAEKVTLKVFRRCREQVICQNKKTTYLTISRLAGETRFAFQRSLARRARQNVQAVRPIACNAYAQHTCVSRARAPPCQNKKTRLTYASRVWQGRRDSPFSDRWRGERDRTFKPFARSRATRMRSILACLELAPHPAKIKKHDLLTQAVFGRGDAIRTRNQWFWRPLLYR